MTTAIATETAVATQYHAYIKATPEAIWNALTKSEWTQRYGYGGRVDYELRSGGAYCAYAGEAMLACGGPEVMIEGDDVTKLTVTHELDGAPTTAAIVGGSVPNAGGGWSFVLSDLKTLLETGSGLYKERQ